MNKVKLKKLAHIDTASLSSSELKDAKYSIFSLPAYDNNQTPEIVHPKDIKSVRDIVTDQTILFNKLNVRFKRIWNIHNAPDNSLCSSEFIRLKPNKIEQDYLYFYLQQDAITAGLNKASGGTSSSHSRISPEDLMSLEILVPETSHQLTSLKILNEIDKLIDGNRKINIILDSLMELTFEYWFLQFDFPNSAGEPYQASGGNMKYDKFSNRQIPVDWESKSISELIKVSKNGDWGDDTKSSTTIEVSCVRGSDINGLNGLESFSPPTRYIENNHTERLLGANDLIIEISGGSPTQSTGRVAHISSEVVERLNGKVVCSNFCKAVSLNDEKISYIVSNYWKKLYDSGVFFNFESKTSGIKNLIFDQIVKDIKIALPKDKVLINDYYNFCTEIDQLKQKNLVKVDELKKLRSMILPMIMTGQIRFVQ